MSDESRKDDAEQAKASEVSELRRRLLQTVAAAAVGLTVLPSKWTKPIVGTIVVPAHAAVSPASPTPTASASPSPSPSSSQAAPTPTPSASSGVGRVRR